jgi:hypothetical protein
MLPLLQTKSICYKHINTMLFNDGMFKLTKNRGRAVSAVAWLGSGQPARLGSIPAGDDFQVSHRGFAPE